MEKSKTITINKKNIFIFCIILSVLCAYSASKSQIVVGNKNKLQFGNNNDIIGNNNNAHFGDNKVGESRYTESSGNSQIYGDGNKAHVGDNKRVLGDGNRAHFGDKQVFGDGNQFHMGEGDLNIQNHGADKKDLELIHESILDKSVLHKVSEEARRFREKGSREAERIKEDAKKESGYGFCENTGNN
ncbi:hypothetical protein ACTFIZ_006850 [Dictyostelium cf. discoideum]